MVVRATPDQIIEGWNVYKDAILLSLPPITDKEDVRSVNIYNALLDGRMQLWLGMDEEQEEVLGIATTCIITDPGTLQRNLLIYSLTSMKGDGFDLWKDGLNDMKEFAKLNRCYLITAYTSNEEVLRIVNRLGGNSKWHYICFGVGK